MTPAQISLARHALGLPNKSRTSYRNRFFASDGHGDFPEWYGMCWAGLARMSPALYGEDLHLFYLTPAGAQGALLPRERLSLEDFPK
jgi:hypothetical protein